MSSFQLVCKNWNKRHKHKKNEETLDSIEENQEKHNDLLNIRYDAIDQVIVTDDDLDTSLSNEEINNELNNDIIPWLSIDKYTSIIREDIDGDISKDTEIKNKDEQLQDNEVYNSTVVLPLKHHEENDSVVNENDEYSSTHQSLDEDYDQ